MFSTQSDQYRKFMDLLLSNKPQVVVKADYNIKYVMKWHWGRKITEELVSTFKYLATNEMEFTGDIQLADNGKITHGIFYEAISKRLIDSDDEVIICDIIVDWSDIITILYTLLSIYTGDIVDSDDNLIYTDQDAFDLLISDYWSSIEPLEKGSK